MSTQRQNQAKPSSPLPVQTSLFQPQTFNDPTQEPDESLHSSHQSPDLQTQLDRASRFGHNFSRVQVTNTPAAIQPQLDIGKSQEQEDDPETESVAEPIKLMAPPLGDPSEHPDQEDEAIQTMPLLGFLTPTIQRQDQEEAIQTMPLLGFLTPPIQRQDQQDEEIVQTMPQWGRLQRLSEEEENAPIQMMPQWGVIQREELETAQEAMQTKWIQTKLVVGAPGDKYEQEADSVAAQVMSMSTPSADSGLVQRQGEEEKDFPLQRSPLADSITPLVQRQTEEQEEQIQAKSLLQRAGAKGNDAGSDLENKLSSSKGGGNPLPDNVRSFMEPRFGSDFSSVRVHTDSTAVQMNKDLGAQAFAHGNDIYYGAGKSPGTDALTAHELTHTIQQTGGIQAKSVSQWVKKENKIQAKAVSAPSEEGQSKTQIKENPQQQTGKNNQAQPAKPASAATADKSEQKEVKHQTPAAKEDTAAKSQKEGSGSKAEAKQNATKPADSGTTSDGAAEGGAAKSPASPQDDPAFQAVVNKAKGVAAEKKKHDPAKAESKEAQDAAEPPANEVESKAQDKQVGEMNQQQPGEFNAEAFKAALMEKIAAVIPNNEEDAKKFKDSNQIDSVKQDMSSQVTQEQEQAAGPIEEKTKEAPDTSGIEPKPVNPLQPPEAGSPQTDIGAQNAAPKPKPESEVCDPLKANSQELDQQMAEAHLTEEQLNKSNEPQFQEALGAKKEAQANAVEAPKAYRQDEKATLNQAQAEAQATGQTQLQGMHGEREQLLAQVMGTQSETQGKDTQERAKIANQINGIYEKTKGEVETVLNGIDGEVTSKFDAGAATAKQKFETYVGQKMEAWEQQRYGEWYDVTGWDERVSDAWNGLPPEVNQFFVDGRQLYLDSIDVTLTSIANFVAQKLNEAKLKIAEGKQKIQEYVAGLPENLRQVGTEAAQNIQGKFDQLEESVNNKQDELIDSLARKYSENLQQIDAEIEKRKEENRGLKDKAKDAIAGTYQTIMQLKDMLMGVLAKAASAIDKIILDPIAFLGNLISGIKQGFDKFAGNIEKHLQKGLLGWLTGALAGAGITMPESFDLKGIFSLVMQVLGVVYEGIKSRVIKALGKNGEKMFNALESSFEMFVILKNEGIAGLWQFLQDKIGDLKVMVIDTIKTFVIENVIKAGVLWVVSLLNPASAFIKACKAIYDIIMFFIERGSQIAQLVSAVTDSIGAIASGAVGGAAALIENALGTSLPVLISFMASLLGLGGISEKVGGIIKQVRAPIDKAIDWLIAQAVTFAKKIGNKLGFGNDKKDNKEEDPEHDKKVKEGLDQLHEEEAHYAQDGKITHENAQKVAASVKSKNPIFKSITVLNGERAWKYHYVASPPTDETSHLGKADEKKVRQQDIFIKEPKITPTSWALEVWARANGEEVLLGLAETHNQENEPSDKDFFVVPNDKAKDLKFEQEGISVKQIVLQEAKEAYKKTKEASQEAVELEITRDDIFTTEKLSGNNIDIKFYARIGKREEWCGDATIFLDEEKGDSAEHLLGSKNKIIYAQNVSQIKFKGGIKFTKIAIEKTNEIYRKYTKKGEIPRLEARLVDDNKDSFQKAFAKLKASGLSDEDAKNQAILSTPFAKGRKPLGYTFRVEIRDKNEVLEVDLNDGQDTRKIPIPGHIVAIAEKK